MGQGWSADRDAVGDRPDSEPRARFEEIAARRKTISRLTGGHLDALSHFVLPDSPGRSLADLQRETVSLPAFQRIPHEARAAPFEQPELDLFDPNQETHGASSTTGASLDEKGLRVSSTSAALRSILRHPGVYYRNIRPLHLLTELLFEFERKTLGTRGLEDTVLPIAQLASAVEAIRQAVEPLAAERADVERLQPSILDIWECEDLLVVIESECAAQAQRDAESIRNAKMRGTRREAEPLLRRLCYSLERLRRVQEIRWRLCGDDEPISVHDLDAALSTIADPSENQYLDLLEREEVREGRPSSAALADAERRFADWWHETVRRFADRERPPELRWESTVSILVANYLVSKCRERLETVLPKTFEELRLDRWTLPHPYVLYWVLEGLRNEPAQSALRERLKGLVDSARLEYYHLVARAAAASGNVDMFRLGFHVAIELDHAIQLRRPGEPPIDLDVAVTAVKALVAAQARLQDGTWPKRDRLWATANSGDAYGFSVEMLTSLLLAADGHPPITALLEQCLAPMIDWLDRNKQTIPREQAPDDPDVFVWATLLGTEAVKPEAWATAECYSFLYVADRYYDRLAARLAVDTFGGSYTRGVSSSAREGSPLDDLDADLYRGSTGEPAPLLADVLMEHVVKPLEVHHRYFGRYMLGNRADRAQKIRSGILFGPPGTGKTTVVEKLADTLGWPLVRLGPYDFLQLGTDRVPEAARNIFDYLLQLRDCVVLFDEMEEFIRSREIRGRRSTRASENDSVPLTAEQARRRFEEVDSEVRSDGDHHEAEFRQRLWTTVLLPLLQDLHDRANILFFVATNHFERVDMAIARQGRFDFKLHVLPPTPERKIGHLLVPAVRRHRQLTEELANRLEELCRTVLCSEAYIVSSTRGEDVRFLLMSDASSMIGASGAHASLIDSEITAVDGQLRTGAVPVKTRFEYFNRWDVFSLASRISRQLATRGEDDAWLLDQNHEPHFTSMLLEVFRDVIPTAFAWSRDLDLLKWSGLLR